MPSPNAHPLAPGSRRHATALVLATAVLGVGGLGLAGLPSCAMASARIRVIAEHLNQPKKITVAPNGDLIVALSGSGAAPRSCRTGEQVSCASLTGAVDEVSPSGAVVPLLTGLSSVSSGASGEDQATGPAQAADVGGRFEVLFQDSTIAASTGREIFGADGDELGDLDAFDAGGHVTLADFGAFEAAYDPDHGAGTDVRYGEDDAIASDPYSFAAYDGGEVVADAAANDVLYVSRTGTVSVLAVLPTIRERAAAHTFGRAQKRAIEARAQAVPTAVAVGPDGAIYVGELGGTPFLAGTSEIFRIAPGHRATVWARGFTAIEDMAFDAQGRLDVLEIDRKGLDDPGFNDGHPDSGAIIRVAGGHRRTLVSRGLTYPTGIAIVGDTAYVSNDGVSPADDGTGGEILAVALG